MICQLADSRWHKQVSFLKKKKPQGENDALPGAMLGGAAMRKEDAAMNFPDRIGSAVLPHDGFCGWRLD